MGHAKAPEGSRRGIVRIVGPAVDLIGLVLIRPRAVGAGPLQHRPTQRGVGSGVGDALRRHALNDAVFIAAQREFHLHGVTLGMDQQTFRPGELHLYRALCEIGDQRGVVLDRYVLLAAEAAAHQTVADLHLLRRQAQHSHDLVLGIVCALIRGEHQNAIPIGTGHGALRFQKGVFRPGGREPPGDEILGFGQCLRRVSPLDVLMGQQIALPVHQRRVRQDGLLRVMDSRQLLVVHLHQRLGLSQSLRCFRRHQTNGIAQIMGDIAYGDHGVPVLFQMAHLVDAGDVRRRQDADHTGQGPGLLRMDGQHPCTGVLAADGAAVEHPVQIDVIRVLAGAGDLFLHVYPVDPAAYLPVRRCLRQLALPEAFCRQQDPVDDLHIAGAAADVVADSKGRLLPAGIRVRVQQRLGGDHHAGDAEAALNGPRLAKGPCVDLLFPIGKTLHRDDGLSLQFIRLGDTGLGGLTVNEHCAGAAGALAASVLHRGQAQLVSQEPQQLLIFLSGYRFAVYRKNSHVRSPLQKVNLLFLELII